MLAAPPRAENLPTALVIALVFHKYLLITYEVPGQRTVQDYYRVQQFALVAAWLLEGVGESCRWGFHREGRLCCPRGSAPSRDREVRAGMGGVSPPCLG